MIEAIGKFFIAVIGIVVLWLMFSWVDVLSHNDPMYGDYQYHPLNIITLVERAVN